MRMSARNDIDFVINLLHVQKGSLFKKNPLFLVSQTRLL